MGRPELRPMRCVSETGLSRSSRAAGRSLLDALDEQYQCLVGDEVPEMKRLLWQTYRQVGGAFQSQMKQVAHTLGVQPCDILTANASYDIANNVGCSTYAHDSTQGPFLARNLDWPFPTDELRESVIITKTATRHGPYMSVTWPGMLGVLTGLAPGRFAVAVNFVRHPEESSAQGVMERFRAGYSPVALAVRSTLQSCASFDRAVWDLENTPLLSPCIFTVAGMEDGEVAVIERTSDGYATRNGSDEGFVCATNHYASEELEDENVRLWGMSTKRRLRYLQKHLGEVEDVEDGFRVINGVVDKTTQHQVAVSPATGALYLRVPSV